MRPFHHATPASMLVLITAATAAPAQECTWETIFDGTDYFLYATNPYSITVATADVDGDGDADTIATSAVTTTVSVLVNNGDADPTVLQFETVGPSLGTAACDFDADGHADLALALTTGGAALHRGLGDGTFDAAVFLDFGTTGFTIYHDIVAVDTNHDGALDLILTDVRANSIGVLHGHGDGTFAPELVYATGATPSGITVIDANRDGSVDLVTANYAGNDLSVLLNLGDGTYAPAIGIAVGNEPTDVVTGDFDGDGIADLAVTALEDSTITTFRGAGDGTFAPGATFWAAGRPFKLSSIDLDGDAYTDLVGTGRFDTGHGVVSLFIGSTGDGDPGLAAGPTYSHAHGGHTVADMNGDGIDDVVIDARGYDVLAGRGDGTLDALPGLAMGGLAIATADLNGDGIADLLATNIGYRQDLRTALGRGDGTFDPPVAIPIEGEMPDLAVADIDDDGDLDVIVAVTASHVVRVLRNAGDGTLTLAESYSTYLHPWRVELADLDEDGMLDLVVSHRLTNQNQIRRGLGDGTFGAGAPLMLGEENLAVADLNGDGHLDLLSSKNPGPDVLLARRLGNGDGTFGPHETFETPFMPTIRTIETADIDGDGIVDVLVGGGYPGTLAMYRGTETGFLPAEVFAVLDGQPADLAIDDFDGDGALDVATVVAGNNDCPTFVFRGTGDGAFEPPICVASTNSPLALVAADFDGNGAADLAVCGTERVTSLHLNTCGGDACPADFDGSGDVGFADLLAVLTAWGDCAGCREDLDGDDIVGFSDLLAVLSAWGDCE